jgi:beta-1,4-mannosyltransferase
VIIYPLPPRLLTNPYLDLLYAPMRESDIDVRRARPRQAVPALLAGRGNRVLHLHFFDELTQRRGALETEARSLALVTLLAALRVRGVRLVWTAHNLVPHELHHPRWAFLTYRYVARSADAVIAHGEAALALVRERYGPLRRAEAIPLGSFAGVYGPPANRATSRASLGLSPAGRVTLSIGALRPYKGLEELIERFAELPADQRGTLLVAGAPKDRAYAAALERQAARVPGALVSPRHVPDEQLPAFLAAADLVALPYRRLLTSAALLLALSYARPVIAPDVGPARELVREGREGFLFAPGDPEALGAALRRALGHPDLDALGVNALAAAAKLDWRETAARTAAVYRAVVAGSGP